MNVSATTRLLKALADPTRLRIVAALDSREVCVCHLQELLRISQPNVSRHLRILRMAGVVTDRRRGPWVHYRLVAPRDAARRALLRSLLRSIPRSPSLQRQLTRLARTKGPDACR